MDKIPEGDTTIIVGDSAYSYNKFIHNLSKRENVAVITRMRGIKRCMRNMKIKKKDLGEKENIIKKYLLNKPDSLPNPDYIEDFKTTTTKKGLTLKIRLSLFKHTYTKGARITECQIYK